jgi:hypothetical protein
MPGTAQLIGLRCQVIKADKFEETGPQIMPTLLGPFSGDKSSFVELQPGTILRVTHLQYWEGVLAPGFGTYVFAEAQNGPKSGHSFLIAAYGYFKPPFQLFYRYRGSPAVILIGNSLVPCGPRDDGWFYARDSASDRGYDRDYQPVHPATPPAPQTRPSQ